MALKMDVQLAQLEGVSVMIYLRRKSLMGHLDGISLSVLQHPAGIFELVELVGNGTYRQQFCF